MKVATHTEGPWQVEHHAPLRDGQVFLEVATPPTLPDGGLPMLICTVQPTTAHERGPDPEQQANARLIAAAPDLLGALRATHNPHRCSKRRTSNSIKTASSYVRCSACDVLARFSAPADGTS